MGNDNILGDKTILNDRIDNIRNKSTMISNVTKLDILEIEDKINIHLTYEQRVNVLNEYNRVCVDKGESWEEILTELIRGYIKG